MMEKKDVGGTTARILNLMADVVNDVDKEAWIDEYSMGGDYWDYSDHAWQIYTGHILSVAKRMMVCGATAKEIWKVLNCLWISINGKKHKMDIKRAIDDFEIAYYAEKYRMRSMPKLKQEEEPVEDEPEQTEE